MDSVLRVTFIYFFLLVVVRATGKRTIAESTPFDLVILLIIGDLVQEAIVDDDHSLTACVVIISTLMFLEVTLTLIKHRFKKADSVIDGLPLIIVDNGKLLKDRLHKARIEEEDILESARLNKGYSNMSQVRFAVLEKGGEISIIGYEKE